MTSARRQPAVLIVNPNAGRLSEQTRTDVVAALRARFQIEAFSTTARDTGISLAADAAAAGSKLVIAFGGDGHISEVANGLACSDSALGIVPGGTMNVFARALDIPLDPFDAVEHLASRVGRAPRVVPLGKMNERYFTFSAGCGFDAEAAQRVERYVPAKRRLGEAFFFWSAVRVLAGTYRHRSPSMVLRGSFGEVPVSMAIASNAGPYAYIAGRPVDIAPDVSLDGGIDVFALKRMRVESLPFYTWRVLVSHDIARHGDAFYASDLDAFDIEAEQPFACHADGEPLPSARSARFTLVRKALRVQS